MNRIRELIYRCSSLNFISCCLKHFQISRKTCRFATDIYHLFNPEINNLLNRFGWIPSLGGSSTIKSGLSSNSSTTFNTSPAINSQLSNPFNSALTFAASTASSTISTPTTFLATGANICAIVPVPLYRSKITLSFVSPTKSLAVL